MHRLSSRHLDAALGAFVVVLLVILAVSAFVGLSVLMFLVGRWVVG